MEDKLLLVNNCRGFSEKVLNLNKEMVMDVHLLLDYRPRPEGSYKIGSARLSSVLPCVLPSVLKFSRNWLISFFLKLSMLLGAHI